MPKYYRFRATTPTRSPKRSKEKEIEKEIIGKSKENENNLLNVMLACIPAPSWYMRRTSWRESPPLMGLPRQIAAQLRASLQLTNRAMFVFKV